MSLTWTVVRCHSNQMFKNNHPLKGWIAIILIAGYCSSIWIMTAHAAVNLLYFQAAPENQKVKLLWATATELNNAGFFVQRSSTQNGSYTRINSLIIPAKGDGLTGGSYEYMDTGVTNGSQYWYRLESIDFSQASQFSDPVSVTVGIPITPSVTPTNTATLATSPTITQPTATLSPSATTTLAVVIQFTPTQNPGIGLPLTPGASPPYPGPGQPPGNQTSIPGSVGPAPSPPGDNIRVGTPSPALDTGEVGLTATLIPFPTVTIIFPPQNSTAAPIPELVDPAGWLFSRNGFLRLWPLGLILVAWAAIGIWFYFSHRHFH